MHFDGRRTMLVATMALAAWVACLPLRSDAVPFWGAKTSLPIDTPIEKIKPGQFVWMGGAVSAGPAVMVVSIDEQRAFVYRNGVLIGVTSVSTGRPGHLTPTGVFTVLQKQELHHSNLYNGAPMPYMERLTWGGVALHAGGLPGYPESHGCVHLPSEFAKLLYGVSPLGMTVVIGNEHTEPASVDHPGYLAPVAVAGGQAIAEDSLGAGQIERWQPQLSPVGPVSIVMSLASQRVVVYRNGVEIGRARFQISGAGPVASHALVLTEGPSSTPDPYVPDTSKYRWLRLGVPGHMQEAGTQVDPAQLARLKLPGPFVAQLNSILTPGATVLVTAEPLSPENSGAAVKVVDAEPPANAS